MVFLLIEIFLFLSCNSKDDNKVSINWVDLYGIETVDFDENPIFFVYYTFDDDYEGANSIKDSNEIYPNKRNLTLNPNIDKNIIINEKDVRNLGVWCSTRGLECYVYPSIKLPDKKRKIEIYLFKDLLPDDNNKLIFMKHEQAIGYSYDFNKDDYTYVVLSKNNVIDLNLNNVRKLTDINIIVNPHEYNIMNLDENEIVYFSFIDELMKPGEYPFCTYYIKSKIDNNIIRPSTKFFVVDKEFKMSRSDFNR